MSPNGEKGSRPGSCPDREQGSCSAADRCSGDRIKSRLLFSESPTPFLKEKKKQQHPSTIQRCTAQSVLTRRSTSSPKTMLPCRVPCGRHSPPKRPRVTLPSVSYVYLSLRCVFRAGRGSTAGAGPADAQATRSEGKFRFHNSAGSKQAAVNTPSCIVTEGGEGVFSPCKIFLKRILLFRNIK